MKYTFSEYKEVFLKSKTILKRPLFYIKTTKIKDKKKLIIVLSKKIGNSVKRNYIRRIIHVLFQKYELLNKFSLTFIIIFTQPKVIISFAMLEQEIIILKSIVEKIHNKIIL